MYKPPEDPALRKLVRARRDLVQDAPVWGALSMFMRPVADLSVPAMATDGTHLFYNPAWVLKTQDAHLRGVIAHEAAHGMRGDPWRLAQLPDHDLANLAADYVINPIILSHLNLHLPDGALNDPQYYGLTVETVYARLVQQQQEQQKQKQGGKQGRAGSGAGDPSGTPGPLPKAPDWGRIQAPPPQAEAVDGTGVEQLLSQQDWQEAAEALLLNELQNPTAGTDPGDLTRMIRDAWRSTTSWKDELAEFIAKVIPEDMTWSPPDTRFAYQGIYLPSVKRDGTPPIVVVVDCSGSIGQRELDVFGPEIARILDEVRPERLDVVYHDTRVTGVESFGPDDILDLHPRGGGGTAFAPVLAWLQEQAQETGMPPACVVWLTDLYNGDGGALAEPDVPILWVTPPSSNQEAPFGRTIRLPNWAG